MLIKIDKVGGRQMAKAIKVKEFVYAFVILIK
jgi:hypothetical protein